MSIGLYASMGEYGNFINESSAFAGTVGDASMYGYYKRYSEKKFRGESKSYYIRSVNEETFNLGFDASYTWIAGATIHVSCFGFKKVVG